MLLDTHAFLWWITDHPSMSSTAREVISDPANLILVSAASAWEIAIKHRLGKLTLLSGNLVDFILAEMESNSFHPLPIRVEHALRVHDLPLLHRDPFDRLLVAQSTFEGAPIVTADREIQRYDVEVLW